MVTYTQKLAKKGVTPVRAVLQRKCDSHHKKKSILEGSTFGPAPETVLSTVPGMQRSPGQQLGSAKRTFTEPEFGHDFRRIPLYSKSPASIRAKLAINAPRDSNEQEAEWIADRVLADPEHHAVSGVMPRIERFSGQPAEQAQAVPASVDQVLATPGRPLEPPLRHDMEQRFGHDFSRVQVHTDRKAAESSQALHAQAYTLGWSIVFGAGRYAPETWMGRRLIAHELTHVLQQEASPPLATTVQRQLGKTTGETTVDDMDAAMERKYKGSGAPKAHTCAPQPGCPGGFCSPYDSEELAKYDRSKDAWWLMLGISRAVDSRVVPLWKEYLWGGSDPKDLTPEFGKDFTKSPTTIKKTTFLVNELKKNLTSKLQFVAPSSKISIDISTLIPTAIAALDDPSNPDNMNFDKPRDIPGNLAGGIGKDQKKCPAGAKPSPFDDERQARGTVELTRKLGPEIHLIPSIAYLVKDTIDLCPGDCGAPLEQIATVPLSQFEATGISGDVPFWVEFPAPSTGSFTIRAPEGPAPLETKPPVKSEKAGHGISPKKP